MLKPFPYIFLCFAALFTISAHPVYGQPPRPCSCPKFEIVSGYDVVKAGEIVEFEAISADQNIKTRKFNWTTSAGQIVAGQGTSKISVQTYKEMLPPTKPPQWQTGSTDRNGYIITGLIGQRRSSFTVVADFADIECSCPSASATIGVGSKTILRNHPADVTDITLSQTELVSPCRPGTVPSEGTRVSETMVIDVVTKALDPDNDPVTYQYTVSGGKIIGSGAAVKWDLTDVPPGTYDITAKVDDGCGICGKTTTKSVTVSACTPTCSLCLCPTFDVTAPFEISSSSPTVFSVNLTAGSFDPTYIWKVENGEIIDGQGTPVITVKMPLNGTEISTVRLNIGGAPSACACSLEVTKTYQKGRLKP